MPLEVLERARAELIDWRGSGMSVLEVSHRGADFTAVARESEQRLRRLLAVPEDYRVVFLQGGATGQFSAIPLNLSAPHERVGYVNTGSWSAKAIAEAKRYARVEVVADEAGSNYTTVPDPEAVRPAGDAAYLHYTPNETIGGVEFGYVPDAGGIPLVADLSSTIMSRPLEVSRFGLIYASTQKNLGPAGLCVVIVRQDLLGRARPGTPGVWDYARMAAQGSLLNTPPTFTWYLLGLTLAWLEEQGGLTAMAERNRTKADLLYAAIDGSDFYSNPVAQHARSWMNVPFLLADPGREAAFLAGAREHGLANLEGHRSVGGMRASIYNAMPLDGVQALIDYLAEFAARHA